MDVAGIHPVKTSKTSNAVQLPLVFLNTPLWAVQGPPFDIPSYKGCGLCWTLLVLKLNEQPASTCIGLLNCTTPDLTSRFSATVSNSSEIWRSHVIVSISVSVSMESRAGVHGVISLLLLLLLPSFTTKFSDLDEGSWLLNAFHCTFQLWPPMQRSCRWRGRGGRFGMPVAALSMKKQVCGCGKTCTFPTKRKIADSGWTNLTRLLDCWDFWHIHLDNLKSFHFVLVFHSQFASSSLWHKQEATAAHCP